MDNFSINTNFNTEGFDNSINNYNKFFSTSFTPKTQEVQNDFEEIFNNISNKTSQKPIPAGIVQFVGLDSINAQKIEGAQKTLSPAAKVANDIGNGISNSLKELNSVQKQAENDFETLASGGDISIHDVMISAQKSSLAMQMAIQLRNQAMSVYNEFRNMSI